MMGLVLGGLGLWEIGGGEQLKSCLKWIGGKGNKVQQYLQRIPEHKIFISAFCGGCHVELAKAPARFELVNDKNNELINFLMVLRDNPEDLYKRCEGLPYSEAIYEKYKWEDNIQDPLERATRFFYIVRCGFSGGGHKYKTGFSVSTKQGGSKARSYRNSVELILHMANRIKDWHILNRDFKEVIRKYDDKKAFHFIDPPYWGTEGLYAGDFKMEDHERLRNAVENLQGKAMICYYDHPEIRQLYKNWVIHEFGCKSKVRNRQVGEKLEEKTELIIMNYEPSEVKQNEMQILSGKG